MSYTHFTLKERKYLQQLLSEGLSLRKIAAILERSPSTISREIRRNRAKFKPHHKPDNPYWYNHWRAQNLYIRRRREQQRRVLRPGTEQWNYIVAGLQNFWSPEAICGRWHKDHPEQKPLHCPQFFPQYSEKDPFKTSRQENPDQRRQLQHHSAGSDHSAVAGCDPQPEQNWRLGRGHGLRWQWQRIAGYIGGQEKPFCQDWPAEKQACRADQACDGAAASGLACTECQFG